MRHKIVSISKAKAKLLELVRDANEQGQAYVLTKDGEPIGALVPMEDYDALLETSDVLADSRTMRDLRQALEDEERQRLWKRDARGKWVKIKKARSAA
jgi:prevent-host-death family protein